MGNEEIILRELLEKVIKNERIENPEIEIKDITSSGANYSSTLHLITIKSFGSEKLELFAKVGNLGKNLRDAMTAANDPYLTERFVYEKLVKIYHRLQVQCGIPEDERLKFAKFYACSDKYLKETMILENLVTKGYMCYDRFKPITWEYGTKAVGELAKLHALSHAFAEDDPEMCAKALEERKSYIFTFDQDELSKMWKDCEVSILESVPEKLMDKFKKFLENESSVENIKKHYTAPKRLVLAHGDYRSSNLLHKQMGDSVVSLIPVDYQTLNCGSQICDLLYFIFTGTDGHFRKQYYKQLIDHYYDTFADFLTKLGLDPGRVYPKDNFDEDLHKTLPFGLLMAMYVLPVVLIDPEDAPTFEGDATLSAMVVKPNETFKTRFREILEDFVDWGIV